MIQIDLYKKALSEKSEELVAAAIAAVNSVEMSGDGNGEASANYDELANNRGCLGFLFGSNDKKSAQTINVQKKTVDADFANKLYKEVERVHRKNSEVWSEFIEQQRQKINADIRSAGFEEAKQTELLDSQMSNSVLRFKVMDELTALNALSRNGDKSAFENYKKEFEKRYQIAVNAAKEKQFEIYEKLQ